MQLKGSVGLFAGAPISSFTVGWGGGGVKVTHWCTSSLEGHQAAEEASRPRTRRAGSARLRGSCSGREGKSPPLLRLVSSANR